MKFSDKSYIRPDVVFSNWIFAFAIIYFIGFKKYNPLLLLIIGLFHNVILFFIYYKYLMNLIYKIEFGSHTCEYAKYINYYAYVSKNVISSSIWKYGKEKIYLSRAPRTFLTWILYQFSLCQLFNSFYKNCYHDLSSTFSPAQPSFFGLLVVLVRKSACVHQKPIYLSLFTRVNVSN